MKVIDQKALEQCRRQCSKRVMNIAEGLANLIEARLAQGLSLERATDRALSNLFWDSVVDWPTVHAAADVLAKTWKHGKAFKAEAKKQDLYSGTGNQ